MGNRSGLEEREERVSAEGKYRVGMVSKMTGLSTHTLRMWEKRYGAVLPKRTAAGGRLYNDEDVERLQLLRTLVESGNSIGGIATLSDGELRQMAAAFPTLSSEPASHHLPEVRARVMAAIEELRVDDAERLLSTVALGTEPLALVKNVIGPTMVEIGDRWERGELRIAHEHACSAVMRSLLFSLMRLYPPNDARRRTVVATPAGEDHELGALMVAMLAAMHGWCVLYLGPNLPADEIAFAVAQTEAELLLLSVTGLQREAAAAEIASIEKALRPGVKMLVGGRAASAPPGSRAEVRLDLEGAVAALSR